ncbi:MAG TPA: HDOD domain-containing protein [Urbifossiella sp.]|nr:HDOD domain-containing protein [Urbifossiella sp.]
MSALSTHGSALSTHGSSGRAGALAAALDPNHLPSPPAVAAQLVAATARTDGRAADIVAILEQDPSLCAKVLRVVNSSLYGLTRPVGSLERAVVILGLKPIRSLALALSLPPDRGMDPGARGFWVESVTGAVLARELAVRARRPSPEDDLVAGLLRDLGVVILQRAFPDAWGNLAATRAECPPARVCAAEFLGLGVNHADVGATVLARWNLPDEVVTPIRYHHTPGHPRGAAGGDRAELLYFVECLTHIRAVAADAAEFARVLGTALNRFRLPPKALAEWLAGVAPKVDEFIAIAGGEAGTPPDLVGELAETLDRHQISTQGERPA